MLKSTLLKNTDEQELKTLLYDMYIKKRCSLPEIRDYFNCNSCTPIYRALKKYNIPVRDIKTASSLEERKSKIEETCLKKYGEKNVLSKGTTIFHKRNNTIKNKYGVENVFELTTTKNKIKQTCLKKYGVECSAQSSTIRKKIIDKRNNTAKNHWETLAGDMVLLDYKNREKCILLRCNKCGHEDYYNKQLIKVRNEANEAICYKCNPFKTKSRLEEELKDFIASIYQSAILFNHKIDRFEYDVVLPDANIAIEFNGLYWHSERNKPKDYHLNKKIVAKNNGYNLIHIYEDDWIYKRKIIESRLKTIISNNNIVVYARSCSISVVDSNSVKVFLEKNHLFGSCPSLINIGLFMGDELLSTMTFSSLRRNMGQKSKDGEFELVRFCSKLNYNIIGGASRLLNYFLKNYKPKRVVSYADLDWVNVGSNLYIKLGFKKINNTGPNYHYIINKKRINRFCYRKNVLVEQGFDKDKSEREIMLSRGIPRIYNSGSIKYELNLNE